MALVAGVALGLPWILGLLLMVGVSLSWFVAVSLKFPELWGYFVGYELMDRFTSTRTAGRSRGGFLFRFFSWARFLGQVFYPVWPRGLGTSFVTRSSPLRSGRWARRW